MGPGACLQQYSPFKLRNAEGVCKRCGWHTKPKLPELQLLGPLDLPTTGPCACQTTMPGSVDAESAVARIAAAADSLDALSMAIEKAAFLDDHPGVGRQKLRGNQVFYLCRVERLMHWYQPHFCPCTITNTCRWTVHT